MEIFMKNIPYTADNIKVTLALEPVLHGPLFEPYTASSGGLMNFKVYLFQDKRHRRYSHAGSGTLTLPNELIGNAFLDHFGARFSPSKVFVDGRDIWFQKSKRSPRSDTLGDIRLLPYRDPRLIQEMERRRADLSGLVHLQDVQFTWLCRDGSISVEWQWNRDEAAANEFTEVSYNLTFKDDTREVVVRKSCDSVFSHVPIGSIIAMRYSRIQAVETDSSAKAILLMLETPPSFEEGLFDPEMIKQSGKKRQKLSHLDAAHATVAPFAWNVLRLKCESLAGLSEFKRLAEVVNLRVHDHHRHAEKKGLFSPHVLHRMKKWLATLDWSVAFLCETMHRDLLLDTVELLDLRPSIAALVRKRGSEHATQVLRQFALHLRGLWSQEDDRTVQSCFDRAKEEIDQGGTYRYPPTADKGIFQCLHVNFTPVGMTLKGPFPDTSNRILRQYPDNHDCFLRVSFTDEDGLKFRFNRHEVDGPEFIERRVGTILKKGFELCGRNFEFLAYSQSALKQYTVWFVTPFKDHQGHIVNAEYIRETIGSTWSEELRRCPARFAARLSQAFTATEASLTVTRDEIYRIRDIERNGYCFSDGNGPLSQEMADAIHDALQQGSRRMTRGRRTPSVFQVRIQGAKGVLSVDSMLSGRQIGLRPSMVKFESVHNNDIEIARSFNRPSKFFLNRPLVMILAGLGVQPDVFLQLQRHAVAETEEATRSLRGAASLLETHGMGTAFALPSIFSNLHKLGLELEPETSPSGLRDAFMERCLKFAVHHVLREIKYRARVPVPESWKLVGVVDVHNVLTPNQIYACIIRGEGAAPEYLQGPILISKSPTIHPGDVQIVQALGPPPPGSRLKGLVNCVVFSQQGDRPLPNKLSGSDLDGDEYDLIPLPSLHPPKIVDPGSYSATPRLLLPGRSTIEDVAEFVVNFINNDMLGIIATNFLLISDLEGIFTEKCATLAELHSWAVDFPKNGIPVPFDEIPLPGVSVKPDWHAPEINAPLGADYYESKSVLGTMFRDVHLPPLSAAHYESRAEQRRRKKADGLPLEDTFGRLSLGSASLNDPISIKLRRRLNFLVDLKDTADLTKNISDLFDHFAAELEHICFSYTLSRKATTRLTEEEVIMGTIVAKSTQPKMRRDNIAAMRDETNVLVQRMSKELEGAEDASIEEWVNRSWTAWNVSLRKGNIFGSKSFGWIALRAIFEAIKYMEKE